ncbi:UDP-N-acetylmuramoyl-L-alanyl-D-glutamate--2,6-diaminopimelate ligase [Halomonas eurihalina]|uniref:UDP-N-acetylmuramoyl-L-alanyl-D-glutamate--2,6-diaminopimelate ligase n=1 Tax=Halomonas eurihalina TaxID=42566 RepID=A0A5D9CVD4_HALER|nr:UDP-N-acetylmuramoyl-L-alanyl-D-glutamate--2,6-diaminopimelate ligase [Halomonas eurihalina]MDR5859589.1 UDP-N-acetylmuramoyl-L-alanyl-D-glutamate--2,6-diaminopimelate ligase [Halomonas eurihalina]TZG35307.1 UDP-N-acetylmuramoyl-L-alanyl-D-glutamate--2,6-diaminopimelate ligase [Halomonas eurihalina]
MHVNASRLMAALASQWPEQSAALEALGLTGDVALCLDSRELAEGDVFLALPGVSVDGRDFIDQALAAGAAAVLRHVESGESVSAAARVIHLEGLAGQLGELGRSLFEVPASLELIGVTGTNGKSSVTHYIAALSRLLGRDAGMVGTLGHGRPGALHEGRLTTPGPLALQSALGELAAEGVERVAMEASSHALEQERLAGCRLTAAVFTNLSRDHLDYHGSMAAYAAAKARLFQRPELRLAVVNGDDPLTRLMLAGLPTGERERARVLAVGDDEAVTLRVVGVEPLAQGQRAVIATPEGERVLEIALMGGFNLTNVLLAIATLHGLGEDLEALFAAAAELTPVPGRMQVLADARGPTVVIDYAHTPDALENALQALRAHLPDQGRLWCLFGCGGDRDAGKRPLMAAAAERYSDVPVITDDNPRGESAATIREQVLAGLSESTRRSARVRGGRAAAIRETIAEADAEDVILIAGKGHETYQEIEGVRHPFSDLDEAQAALAERHGEAPQ